MATGFADPDALDAFALEKMIATRLPGLVLLLIENGEVVHRRGLGFADVGRRTPPGSDTLIGIGSITKLFTALAVMQLQERGKLDLDDPVSTHLGHDLRARGEPVRIRHLLSHSSGIPALGFSESKMSRRWSTDGYPVASAADMLTFMSGSDRWDQAAPGERWAYLNEGYVLLGAIIEAAGGGDYRDHIRQALLEPLGMTRSHFDRALVEREPDRVTPYMLDRDNRLFVGSNLYSEIPAAGGLVSTAEDLAKLALMLLNGGRSATGAQVVTAASLETMRQPVVALPAVETDLYPAPAAGRSRELFGLGLYLQEAFLGVDVIGHGGGVMGSTGYLGVIPERGLGVVLQTNGHGYPMRQLARCSTKTAPCG
jgi:CubicO group peptidase (beta-lactamase class C family)